MSDSFTCPSCNTDGMRVFYEAERVPAHSVLLMPDRETAVNYPRGDIRLAFCPQCGFISNVVFDHNLHEYSDRYEETQGFSETFNTFSKKLATHLIDRYDLNGKDIIEIGCGKGEFLTLICELGNNHGVGFDPAYVSERSRVAPRDGVTFIQDFYSEKYADYAADFVCCKMTLEHIDQTDEFIGTVRRTTEGRPDTIVFFQIPDVRRVLRDIAFWDIYYEHCSYFSPGSLARLFRQHGFSILDLSTDYDDQYLMIEAKLDQEGGKHFPALEDDLDQLTQDVQYFTTEYPKVLEGWKNYLQDAKQSNKRVVLWGSGSKAVAFLTILGITDEIAYGVDINPHKHGTYLAGTGHEIVGPEFLRGYQPDIVIAMNPVYRQEIQRDLDRMGVSAELRTI
ncbi:MAG: methyltransferase domain-containing protein [Chloroflexi bacterium AL-W]|nr:methyltransferase domain-containing protein [Chloroflexi bacterium AL-N1]NOK71137.1 methyltransferase domain-containing protein [Chloroflexi bacterium AL-N10]NOK78603.1 methyltransferase domain-containing protein [Chloroflexi bacterium AL-N5]NOK85899.1 methyltransferase domain-containing protein [Chloroflexi bacterium AL-W]NOK92874.1 methyltransferase domain-containing protein [Chloroflexi bacterium AL-N15]